MGTHLFPLFVKLAGKDVVVVGGGSMAVTRVRQLVEAGARVKVIAPEILPEAAALAADVQRRPFCGGDLDGAWFAVGAATPEVNREVERAAEARRVLVNAVDDPEHATAYTAAVFRRGDVTVALSTGGRAPALAALLRRALEVCLPDEVAGWVAVAERERAGWKRSGVPLKDRRALLLERLLAGARESAEMVEHESTPAGFVSIVGAGPGDPGLLTRRAAARMRGADVVLHDALVPPELLALAPRAHRFPVGKRAGKPSASQRVIERLLIRAARSGKRVVRLKCGDPFVFGRGGEEAIALAEASVPFEVVPGVSTAIAAPALAGIPVTHRGTSAGFVVVSGHSERTYGPLLDGLAPGALPLVVLMGLGNRASIGERLLARGWPRSTPAAIVLGASVRSTFTWRGTLEALGSAELPEDRAHLPGTLVVGAVAALNLSPDLWRTRSRTAQQARTA